MTKTNWKELIWGGLIFALLVGLTLYGVTSRPIIDYRLNCPDNIYISSNVLSPTISLEFRNRGEIDADTLVTIKSYNANMEPTSKTPVSNFQNKSISFHYILQKSESYNNEQIRIINVDSNVSSFTVVMSIEKAGSLSISGIFSKIFGEPKGYYPTVCDYNKTEDYWSGDEYKRTY